MAPEPVEPDSNPAGVIGSFDVICSQQQQAGEAAHQDLSAVECVTVWETFHYKEAI